LDVLRKLHLYIAYGENKLYSPRPQPRKIPSCRPITASAAIV
jgi:hypothetical protein